MQRLLPICFGLFLLGPSAHATQPRLRLERIDPSDFSSQGVVRVYASVVELEGTVDDSKPPPAFSLLLDGRKAGKLVKATSFQSAHEPLDLVLIVESSALYSNKKAEQLVPLKPKIEKTGAPKKTAAKKKGGKASKYPFPPPDPVEEKAEPLEKIKEPLKEMLAGLNQKWRVLLISYSDEVTLHPPFKPAPASAGEVEDLAPDEAGELHLADAVRAGLIEIKKSPPDTLPPRRLLIVISDGLNLQMDRKTFRQLGELAGQSHVPIHTIAFSPTDDRGPLLNLAEISKRSGGTFRWARTGDDVKNQIETLADELNKQYVLSFELDSARTIEGKTFSLRCEDLNSNALRYTQGAFDAAVLKRGLGWWWLLIVAGALALGIGGLWLRDRMSSAMPTVGRRRPLPTMARRTAPPQVKPITTTAPPARASGPVPTRASLMILSGGLTGQRLQVSGQPLSIGKGPSSLQINDDPTVSTRHAQVALTPRGFFVTDLGSTNGTFVNNQKVTQPTLLSDGDLLRCGNTQMKFRTEQ